MFCYGKLLFSVLIIVLHFWNIDDYVNYGLQINVVNYSLLFTLRELRFTTNKPSLSYLKLCLARFVNLVCHTYISHKLWFMHTLLTGLQAYSKRICWYGSEWIIQIIMQRTIVISDNLIVVSGQTCDMLTSGIQRCYASIGIKLPQEDIKSILSVPLDYIDTCG